MESHMESEPAALEGTGSDHSEPLETGGDGAFTRQATPYIANGERLTRVWFGGWSASFLDQDGPQSGYGCRGDTLDFLQNEGPVFGELYEIQQTTMGTGSFGLCYPAVAHLAEHSEHACCMKIVDKEQAGEEYRTCLVEAGMFGVLLRKKLHPNIVHYFDFMESPLYYYVVMQSLSGPDLFDQFMEDYPVTETYVQNIMKQVLAALQQLRCDGIVHRDVKLENFRYAEKGADACVKLLDFGFARRVDDPWESKISGTLMYLAPEIVADTPAQERAGFSAASDVWAAGVVLCMLLTGQEPFNDRDVWNLGRSNGESIRTRLLQSHRLGASSPEARDLVSKLLTIDHKARISAADALNHPWYAISSPESIDVSKESYLKAKASSQTSHKFINEPAEAAKARSRNRLNSLLRGDKRSGGFSSGLHSPGGRSGLISPACNSPKLASPTLSHNWSGSKQRQQLAPKVATVPELTQHTSSVSLSSGDDGLFCYD
jgi:serine/threonine protein kinase